MKKLNEKDMQKLSEILGVDSFYITRIEKKAEGMGISETIRNLTFEQLLIMEKNIESSNLKKILEANQQIPQKETKYSDTSYR